MNKRTSVNETSHKTPNNRNGKYHMELRSSTTANHQQNNFYTIGVESNMLGVSRNQTGEQDVCFFFNRELLRSIPEERLFYGQLIVQLIVSGISGKQLCIQSQPCTFKPVFHMPLKHRHFINGKKIIYTQYFFIANFPIKVPEGHKLLDSLISLRLHSLKDPSFYYTSQSLTGTVPTNWFAQKTQTR